MAALDTVKTFLDGVEVSDEALSVYLDMAAQELLAWVYGKDNNLEELPKWLEPTQIMAVVTAFNQRGAEGELQEMVDGVTHTFKHDSMISYIHDNAPGHARLV